MGRTIGIDLGTTNSCMAMLEGDQVTVIENAEGGRATPSVVAFTADARLVGTAAKRQAVTNPTNTIFSIQRFMGRKAAEVREEEAIVPYTVTAGPGGDARVVAAGREYSPPEISAMILQKLKADAEAYLGETVDSAVITVPAYFNDDQRHATKDAGRIAGLDVKRLINATTAASLAYGLDKEQDRTILVFDLGGGKLDISILEIGDGVFEVKSTAGDNHLGGDNFDKAIVDWLAAEFKRAEGIDLTSDEMAVRRLYEAAEKAKIELSSAQETRIDLPFITADASGPKHLGMRVSRRRLNELGAPLIERVVAPVRQALDDAKAKGARRIDHVVLVGGMTRMPAVRERVRQLTGIEPERDVNPDEVVAVGAAVQAGVLAGDVKDVLLLDVTPLTLGLETRGGVMTKLIERNTTIPTRKSEVFSTAEDNQPSVEIHVLQGEREMAAYNKSLGKFQLTGIPPAPRGIPQIEVAFNIDASGILEVSAKDLGTGREQRVEIKSGGGLSDDEIRRMVSDAESYAGEDTRERELAEARNAGESAVHQAERQIEELGEDIDAASRTEVETAIQQLRGALEFGDADYIRASTERLRAAFHDVAEAMYERAQAAAREPAPYEPGSFSEILQDTFVRRAPSPAEPEPEPPPAPSAEPAGDGPRWVAVINYRRDDSAEAAERLYDGLTRHFGEDRIFLDIKVPPGTDYRDEIEDAIASTGTVLVVIGPRWLTVADDAGRPRLQKRTDLVRAEIELALDTDSTQIIPVLVDDAEMPEKLPLSIRSLLGMQAYAISQWESDVERLVRFLRAAARR